MDERKQQDPREIASALSTLPVEDRLQIRGVIIGMQLAHKAAEKRQETEAGERQSESA